LVTVTQVARDVTCQEALDSLGERLKRLRKREEWKKAFDGGVGVTEIKLGRNSGEWHVHQHMICTGKGMSKQELGHVWFSVTGDSWIVDVQPILSPERAAGYVSKYLTKGFDPSLVRCPDRLAECISASSGRRLLVTFGSWYNQLSDCDKATGGRWRVVGGLDGILLRAEAGDEWALGVVWGLRQRQGLGVLGEFDNYVGGAGQGVDGG
jgi:hypothetical protein